VRTTLTLDDDVASKLQAEAQQSGQPFRKVVNEAIRRGLATKQATLSAPPFKVTARSLGKLRAGLNLDNIEELLDEVEGPWRR